MPRLAPGDRSPIYGQLGRRAGAALAVIACLAFWPLYASFSLRASAGDTPASLQSFKPLWNASQPFTNWTPRLTRQPRR